MKQLIKKFLYRLRGYFPSRLPVGASDFHKFADSVFWTYNLPNLPSYRHAIASMIMHLGPQVESAPKRYFARTIKKAMANQVAYEVIQEIKEQQAQAKAAEETPSVATEAPVSNSNGLAH